MPAVYASMFTAGNGPIYASMGEAAPDVAAGAPASVTLTATGGTTMLVTWVPGAGGAATAFDVELEASASGTWVTATGAANPTAGGAVSFAADGLTVVTPYRARVRAKKSGFADSAYTTSSTVLTDNVGTGGAVIGAADTTAPTLTGSITITALTSTSYTATCPAAGDAVGVTGYQWRLGGSGAWTDILSGGRSVNITGRTPASTDGLEMRARDAAGNFSLPLTTAVTLLPLVPYVPTITTEPLQDENGITLGGTLIAKVMAVRLSDMTLSCTWSNQTTSLSGVLTLPNVALTTVPHLVVTSSANGSAAGVKVYTPV